MTANDVNVKLEQSAHVARHRLALGLSWLFFACAIGCGKSPDDDLVERVAQGKMPALRNPPATVIAKLAADPSKAKVSAVWLMHIDLADEQWAHLQNLAQLSQIKAYHFAGTQNTDAFVANLPARDKVSTIEFHETDLTDVGLAEVVKLTQLEELRLEFKSQRIAAAKLSELKALTSLKKLHLTSDAKLSAATYKASSIAFAGAWITASTGRPVHRAGQSSASRILGTSRLYCVVVIFLSNRDSWTYVPKVAVVNMASTLMTGVASLCAPTAVTRRSSCLTIGTSRETHS